MVKVYIGFKGNCEEAMEFYRNTLDGKNMSVMRYGEIDKEHKDFVLHGEMEIDGTTFMFCDYMEDMVIGENFTIALHLDNEEKVKTYYERLKVDGKVVIELGDTPFSPLYGNVTDKFGVSWIIML